jgi:hypothetical protein
MELSARGGAEWLCRANRPDGRFVPGYIPALRAVCENDHYLRQVHATLALARAAAYQASGSGQENRSSAVARQAILTLLLDTELEPADAQSRRTSFPPTIVSRLASAGLLVSAINELPAPADDILEQSEQLCRYIGRQQQADGSLSEQGLIPGSDNCESTVIAACEALYGLVLSQRYRPAEWKIQVLQRGLTHYQLCWRIHPSLGMLPRLIDACSEFYAVRRDPSLSGYIYESADWLLGFQYIGLDANHPLWTGGFMGCSAGHPMPAPPHVENACLAEALANAYRTARQAGDVARARRYRDALERVLQFLTTLQYIEANVQHFADWYRPALVGAFHASTDDGNLRIDYNAEAVSALVAYLTYVAR